MIVAVKIVFAEFRLLNKIVRVAGNDFISDNLKATEHRADQYLIITSQEQWRGRSIHEIYEAYHQHHHQQHFVSLLSGELLFAYLSSNDDLWQYGFSLDL